MPTTDAARPAVTRRAALAAGLGAVLAAPAVRPSSAQGAPVRVGVLHSLSGTMAISETALRDTVLMMVEWINGRGGLLGRKVEAVVVDPASNWPLFAEKARELLQVAKVDVTFGCWTSVSRKSVLPVFEELNGLLFYPVQYEGEEQSRNVFYTGAAPNQQAIPAVEYLLGADGAVLDRRAAGWGILHVPDGDFAAAFDSVTGGWRAHQPGIPAVAAGMVGSAQGWVQAPYCACPAGVEELAAALTRVPNGALHVVPGVAQSGPPDVMRGEETEVGHVVRLVEHGDLNRLKGEQLLTHQVFEPAGAGDDNVDAGAQCLFLPGL